MSENNTSDSYEVGYGKPPRSTQFKKGVSGNPKGRPKKALDFDNELLRQSRASITLNDNGLRKRISKHEAVIMQLLNKAMGGNISAARTYLDRHQAASEKVALLEVAQSRDLEKYNDLDSLTDGGIMRFIVENSTDEELESFFLKSLPDEELERIIAVLKDKEKETKKGTLVREFDQTG